MAQASEIESAAQQLAIGNIIGGNYRLVEKIGQGGMGLVFRASHVVIDSEYALKVLAPEQVNESSWLRFQSEARTMAALSHPTFVKVYDLGVHEGRLPFYTMDLLKGVSLESLVILKGSLPLKITVAIFLKILDGLAYAHRNGIVHRDLKPSNIMLCGKLSTKADKLVVKILDFGIAKATGKDSYVRQSLTLKGDILGSPAYMSPEQCLGKDADIRSDIYSVGCCLFETLTGFVPFDGQSAAEIISLRLQSDAPQLSDMVDREFPESLEYVVAKCLARSPEERYQSAKELAIDLARVGEGRDLKRYRSQLFDTSSNMVERQNSKIDTFPWLTAVVLPAVLLAAFIGWLLLSGPAVKVAAPVAQPAGRLEAGNSARAEEEFFCKEIPNREGYVEVHYPVPGSREYGLEGTRLSACDPVTGERQPAVPVSGVFVLDTRMKYWLYADSDLAAHPERLNALRALKITTVVIESTKSAATIELCRQLEEYFKPESLSLRSGGTSAAKLLENFSGLRSITLDALPVAADNEKLVKGLDGALASVEGVKFVDVDDVDVILRSCLSSPRLNNIFVAQKSLKDSTVSLLTQFPRSTIEVDLEEAGEAGLIRLINLPGLKRLTIGRFNWSSRVVEALRHRRNRLHLRLMAVDSLPVQLRTLATSSGMVTIDLISPGILGSKVRRVR